MGINSVKDLEQLELSDIQDLNITLESLDEDVLNDLSSIVLEQIRSLPPPVSLEQIWKRPKRTSRVQEDTSGPVSINNTELIQK